MPTVGYQDFNSLISSSRMALGEGDITANRLAQLGQQVGQSIQLSNYKKQAEEMTPLISQSYQKAFEDIRNGNIGSGVGLITQISAQTASNPFLAPVTQQANRLIDNAMNEYGANQRQQAAFGQAQVLESQRAQNNMGLENTRTANDRALQAEREAAATGRTQAEIASREKIATMPARTKEEMTPFQQAETVGKVNSKAQEIIEQMGNAKTPEDFLKYYQQYTPLRNAAEKAGVDASNPYLEQKAVEQLSSISTQIDEVAAKISKGETKEGGIFGIGATDLKEKLKKLGSAYDQIAKASQRGIREGKSDHIYKPEQSDSGAPPVPNAPEGTKLRNKQGVIYTFTNGQWVK